MSARGQTPEAWIARWQTGACPVHGTGCVARDDEPPVADGYRVARCARAADGCTVQVALWPGKDAHHARLGWLAGPDDVRAALVKAGQIQADGAGPGRWARETRTSWPLEPG